MAKKPTEPDIRVSMPYTTLQELLGAAAVVDDLRRENKSLQAQVSALRLQFSDLLEQFRLIQD